MYSVLDLGYYFIKKSLADELYLTSQEIMILCFFAHGYKLAFYNEPLLYEKASIENKRILIYNDLYRILKSMGKNKITKMPEILSYDPENIKRDHEVEIIESVFEELTNLQDLDIIDLIDINNVPLKNNEIKKYFENLL